MERCRCLKFADELIDVLHHGEWDPDSSQCGSDKIASDVDLRRSIISVMIFSEASNEWAFSHFMNLVSAGITPHDHLACWYLVRLEGLFHSHSELWN